MMRPAMDHRSISALWADAVFVSALQRGDDPGAGEVRRAVAAAVEALGQRGCAGRVAQEFGDHPEAAVTRMRWARQVAGQVFGEPGPASACARTPARRTGAHASRWSARRRLVRPPEPGLRSLDRSGLRHVASPTSAEAARRHRDWQVIPSPVPPEGNLDDAVHVPSLLYRKVDGGSAQGAAKPRGSDQADTGRPGCQDRAGW